MGAGRRRWGWARWLARGASWLGAGKGQRTTPAAPRFQPWLESLESRWAPSVTVKASLLADINPGSANSYPSGMTNVNGTVFFQAEDPSHGNELWKSNGTAAGTVLVKDINPGTAGSNPFYLTNVNGTLYFTANDGSHGFELFKSDGTAAGTVLVKDINPGSSPSSAQYLTNVNGTLFFNANDGVHGNELWKSDGTAAGTQLVKDINSGSAGSNPQYLTNVNGTLFFTANDGVHGQEVWKSDGTVAGTQLVRDIYPGSGGDSVPQELTNVNGTLFFSANDGLHGKELWKSDGTAAGTTLVQDIYPGNSSSYLHNLTNVNGTLFFSANDGGHGDQVWKSDGTAAGTQRVSNIHTDNVSGLSPQYLTNVNGTVFFSGNDGSHGDELWKSDGTAAGTVLVQDINPGATDSYPQQLTNINGTLFFDANDGFHGDELWQSDGTAAGTHIVQDINLGGAGSHPEHLTNVNGTLFFAANDGIHGKELWVARLSQPRTAGLVLDINPGLLDSSPRQLTNVNGTFFFAANDGVHGKELWKSDGTSAGTVMVKDINPGSVNDSNPGSASSLSYPYDMVNVNGTLFFRANDGSHGEELWKSDGTSAGTLLVKDINPGSAGSDLFNLTNVNGTLFFQANDGSHGQELWKSDGTSSGTVMVKDINPGSAGSIPDYLTNVNGTLFFTANDGTHGYELFKSDGTSAGTVMVKDINPGPNSSVSVSPPQLTNVNGTVFFNANDGSHGYELWKSDGTAAGTVMVKDIFPGSHDSKPQYLTNVNGTLFFNANDGTHGKELWKSDGTAAGTKMVSDINPGSASSNPFSLTNVNGTLFFDANDPPFGYELWRSDGTAAHTNLVRDINPGTANSIPDNLTNVSGTLYFTANSGNGYELWQSNGYFYGTQLVRNLKPGSNGPSLGSLTNVEGNLFFAGDDGSHGQELWGVLPLATTFPAVGGLQHQVGRAEADGWSANTFQDAAGYLSFGPYTTSIPGGSHTATFRLLVDNNTYDDAAVATLDVYSSLDGQELAERVVRRGDFQRAGVYQDFQLGFASLAGQMLEFRVFYDGNSYLKEQQAQIAVGQDLVTPPANGLPLTFATNFSPYHKVGRTDGDGWSANTFQDSAGYLTFGPYTTAVTAGTHTAVFSLLVDNNSYDDAPVATLDVYSSLSGLELAERVVRRGEFLSPMAYQNFALEFNSLPGETLEFRVFYDGNSYLRAGAIQVVTSPVFEAQVSPWHQVGRADAEGWSASTQQDQAGYLSFGPYTTAVPAGTHTAVFRLLVDNNSYDNAPVATLDVYSPLDGVELAERVVRRNDFEDPNAYESFDLVFSTDAGRMLEFRVFYDGNSYLKEQEVKIAVGVDLVPDPTGLIQTYPVASLGHQVGRADNGGWSASTQQDQAGYLSYGPYTTTVGAGTHTAVFQLLVDNNSYDDAPVAVLDVYSSLTGRELAERVVHREDFTLPYDFQNFDLGFSSDANETLEFRVFYVGNSYLRENWVGVTG